MTGHCQPARCGRRPRAGRTHSALSAAAMLAELAPAERVARDTAP